MPIVSSLLIIKAMNRPIISLCFALSLLLSAPLIAAEESTPSTPDASSEEAPDTSAATPPPIPTVEGPRTEPSPDLSRLQELVKNSSPETEVIWLESSDDRTIGLFHPQSQPEALGGIILFPSEGTHADWPDYAHPLRLQLSDQGWNTLSLQLPTPPTLLPPKRTLPVLQLVKQNGSNGEEGSTEEGTATDTATPTKAIPAPALPDTATDTPLLRPYPERIQGLANTALNTLMQRGAERIVVIGVGSGAVWASQFVRDNQEVVNSLGLVIINPATPSVDRAPVLAELIPALMVPVVDIYQGEPSSTTLFEAPPKQRLRWARRNQLTHYMQRRLSNRYQDWEKQERWLGQQVDGLIRRHILAPMQTVEIAKEIEAADNAKSETAPGG